MTTTDFNPTIAVIGAGGKMGTRVSDNLAKTDHTVFYSENSPAGQERIAATGRAVTDTETAARSPFSSSQGISGWRKRALNQA